MPTAYPGQPAYTTPLSPSVGPVAWAPPPENMSWDDISIIESEEGVIESGVGGSISHPFNPNEVGIGAHGRNEAESAAEIDKQQGSIRSSYWNAFVTGMYYALPGVGPAIVAHKQTGGKPSYPFMIEDRELQPRFNPGNTGIAPRSDNERSAANEEDKQGGYDWSLLLPANWIQTVQEYLAAQEAAKEDGSLPLEMAEDLKEAGTNAVDKAEDAAEGGKKIIDFLGGTGDPENPFAWLGTSTGMMALGVGGVLLLILLVK